MRKKVRSTADRYGDVGANADWRVVLEHYHWDRVIEARHLALELGAAYGASVLGWYRMIEGEAITRDQGAIRQVNEWLQIETTESELDEGVQTIIVSACDEAARHLRWHHDAPALVSILSEEADAPWHGSRFGYFVDKYPYDKICIPSAACRSSQQLRDTVIHEYTHLIVLNRSEGKAPDWLQESLAMLIEGEALEEAAFPFLIGRARWLTPTQLEHAFHAERREPASYGRIWHAYQQAAVIGQYLLHLDGWSGIDRLLTAFSNNGFWTEFRLNVSGRQSIEEALKEAYSVDPAGLFEEAFAWIRLSSRQ